LGLAFFGRCLWFRSWSIWSSCGKPSARALPPGARRVS
jgi:hypothetical protein